MERIKQAVEQAAKDRAAARPGSRADTSVAPANSGRAVPEGGQVSASEVQYTQTKTIEVSVDTLKRNRVVAGVPGHPLRDTYRMLRTRVLQEMASHGWNTIAITSPAVGSGKSMTAVNLAISLAMDLSHLVLLLDGDLRNPKIHRYFDYEPEFGLSDFLTDDVPISKIMFHPGIDRLTVLPGRESISQSAEQWASPKAFELLRDLRTRYPDRIIVVDVPPVLSLDDALALAPNVDCMLMVAESGETTKEQLYESLDLLEGIPLVGTVLNKTDQKLPKKY